MNLYEQQIINEYTFDKSHTVETIRDNYSNLEPEVLKYIEICKEYFSQTDFSYVLKDETKKNWDTKQERFEFMQQANLTDICWEVVVWSTIKPLVTFTEVVGHMYKKLAVTTDRQGIETAADLIALLSDTPFIEVIYPRDADTGVLMIKSNAALDEDMKTYLSNQRYILPSLVPPAIVETNSDTGYESIRGSVILSGNHHEKHLALDHINRQNAIALELDVRVLKKAEPVLKPKTKAEALMELDVLLSKQNIFMTAKDKEIKLKLMEQERLAAFIQCNTEGVSVCKQLIQQGNKFYLTNKFDEGGRCYAQGYSVNIQGNNYHKSHLILANKELIEME